MRRLGLMAVGVAAGLALTVILLEYEKHSESAQSNDGTGNGNEERSGRFAEICGSTVRMYEVKNGHFCGYTDTKVFESPEKAMEWIMKETDAKMVIRQE